MSSPAGRGPLIDEMPTELIGVEEEAEGEEPTRIAEAKVLGRYELVWELGTGGMANVYLARVRGPAGFHKWLAIKRIHPHLAKDPRFVEMFLDEARIAAAVHHPNVAHVFDLGEDAGERFIAMEYLHGEHLGSVAVRAVRARGRLEPDTAARIIASAADGLHHAHESRDAYGRSLGLVHRDVSPQNIFVTYDGSVKLTDFGIAKAAGRLTHTQTGGTKGKVSYMAPEQALGQAVDRRTDVWALGVVLWECTTGRRLFKGETDAQTLLRITSGQVRAPSEVVPTYPAELERIIMRALEARPADRHPSAAAMARELERWLATTGRPLGAPELASLMRELFGDRIGLKERILGGRAEETVLTDALARAAIGSASDSLSGEASESRVVARTQATAVSLRRWARAGIVALIALVLLAGGTVGLGLLVGPRESVVRIDSDPAGAVIVLDGVRQRQRTPALLEHVKAGRHALRLEVADREPLVRMFDAQETRIDLAYDFASNDALSQPLARASPQPATPSPSPSPSPSPVAVPAVPEPSPVVALPEPPPPTPTAPPARPTSRPVRAPAPPPAAPGYLNLITRPWATVSINGRSFGSTPFFHKQVPSGDLVVRLRAQRTGPARTVRIHIAPGETESRNLDLATLSP